MSGRVLITGGAGFIGSHLADVLLRCGYRVRAFDNLSPQVHGDLEGRPSYLDPDVELIEGDVRDPQAVRDALRGVDAVYHFAAMVGVGQSMYEVSKYTAGNGLGTAVLLEALIERPVERLVVASSMSIYGEGLYRTPGGRLVSGIERGLEQLKRGEWELRDAEGVLTPVPTPENKTPSLAQQFGVSSRLTINTLQKSQPVITYIRPFAPELIGWIRDFGQGASAYDANGHYARIQPIFNAFSATINPGVLTPIPPSARGNFLQTDQNKRCPGAAAQPPADKSAPFTDDGRLLGSCEPSQVPPGP